MKTAVDKMQNEVDLIGDGSQVHSLPTIQGRHKDLKSVTPHTVSQLLTGEYDDVISSYRIIDCRYPYEYEGGHIEGAENFHTHALITDLVTSLQGRDSTQRNILVFHCEFSSERGPKLLRLLRNLDRKLNSDRYPFLFYPEVYLLDGGYKAFYEQHQSQCNPRNYVPMLHQDYSKQLRHFRVKSKSWTAGEKQSMRSRRLITDSPPLKMSPWCPQNLWITGKLVSMEQGSHCSEGRDNVTMVMTELIMFKQGRSRNKKQPAMDITSKPK
ncbi:M-phase inducer phosphatase-like [Haliotis cracherodii]|uniref:M-phase inducer phosphatase-like n=1 Tax=Haliotis cracherodii TaxID=6455 RepID=UPI0039EB9A1F